MTKCTNAGAPKAAAVITGRISRAIVKKAVAHGADLIEARVDTFADLEAGALRASFAELRKITRLPVILTIRSRAEGGAATLGNPQRGALYSALIPLADLVDIELSSSTILKDVVKLAKREGKKVIISYHNFKTTPGDKKLRQIVGAGRAAGADIVKLACHVNSTAELRRLAGLLCSCESRLIVIGMGALGRPSRILFPMIGSAMSFGSITAKTAPGQVPVRELKKEFKRYGF